MSDHSKQGAPIASAPDTSIIHLVWAPSGPAYLRQFLNACRENPPGIDHELVLLYNGFESELQHEAFDAIAAEVPHVKWTTDETILDLEAYRQFLIDHRPRYAFFANSYARPLVSGWLRMLRDIAARPEVGLVGCTGSWESMGSESPLVTRPLRLAQFKPFPNPHIRSGSFMVRDDVLDRLEWPKVRKKIDAWKLENGRRSLSSQVLEMGLDLVVCGRDGRAYSWQDWPSSHTFRASEQENLMIADNRSDIWFTADAGTRAEQARLAWGAQAEA